MTVEHLQTRAKANQLCNSHEPKFKYLHKTIVLGMHVIMYKIRIYIYTPPLQCIYPLYTIKQRGIVSNNDQYQYRKQQFNLACADANYSLTCSIPPPLQYTCHMVCIQHCKWHVQNNASRMVQYGTVQHGACIQYMAGIVQ